jgi:hypothetical protein
MHNGADLVIHSATKYLGGDSYFTTGPSPAERDLLAGLVQHPTGCLLGIPPAADQVAAASERDHIIEVVIDEITENSDTRRDDP